MWGYCLRGPSFIRAKFRSYRWIAGHRDRLRERRHLVESLRRSSDWGSSAASTGAIPSTSSSPWDANGVTRSGTGSVNRGFGRLHILPSPSWAPSSEPTSLRG